MSRHARLLAAINITPLIDVMLVLLIIFMVVAGDVPYARVVEVVDTARGAGAERIGLLPEARP